MTLQSRLQISSFFTDLILLQNKTKYYGNAKKNKLGKYVVLFSRSGILQNTRTKSTSALKNFLLKAT